MSVLEEIIIGNFSTWIILLSLFMVLIDPRFRDKKVNWLFSLFATLLLVLDVSDIMEFYLGSLGGLSNWRYVTSAVGYILRPASIMLIILILLRREQKSKLKWVLYFPLAAEAIIVISSPWTGWVFSFDANNHFLRGVIGYLPHIISGIYLAILLVLTIVVSSHFDKTEILTVYLVSAMALLATILESVLSYRFLVVSSLSASCLIYYLYFFLRQSRIDPLTGLYNRRCFFTDLGKLKSKSFVLVSVDLNNLKLINDTGGHAAGDEALVTLSNCLLKAGNKYFSSYRLGGDEFLVVGLEQTSEAAESYVVRARDLLAKTPYMASFGCSLFHPGDDFDARLKESDETMYLDKKRYRHR